MKQSSIPEVIYIIKNKKILDLKLNFDSCSPHPSLVVFVVPDSILFDGIQ